MEGDDEVKSAREVVSREESPGLLSPKPTGSTPKPAVASTDVEQSNAVSRKRSSAELDEEDVTSLEPGAKRQRTEEESETQAELTLPTPSPSPEPLILAEPVTTPFYDDAQKQLLQRSCALVLEHVGFDSASREAMESLYAEVDIYMKKVLSYVTESMLASRRSQPTPPDFEFAMRHMGLTSRLLTPHLKPPLPPSKTQLVFRPAEAEAKLPQTPAKLLGKELSGEPDKKTKRYIPQCFPGFPSQHTYKSTSVMAGRENDPRKIREKATQAARNAEEALRRLVKVGKTAHVAKRRLENNKARKARNDLWEQSMTAFSKDQPEMEEKSISVDAGKRFWRRPVVRSAQQSANGP